VPNKPGLSKREMTAIALIFMRLSLNGIRHCERSEAMADVFLLIINTFSFGRRDQTP
jgi:hypothetical protein